jgi:2-polyprenyl-3-methyl-5-hydroxy-6-metoxy-1,4-benzoquinol methylase
MADQEDIYKGLENINTKVDPWETKHPYNQKAFDEIISLIKMVPHDSILEIGCAQGEFTKKLLEISKNVTAIDVSRSAINQAREKARLDSRRRVDARRVKGAHFEAASLENFYPERTFDVVVCAEILYYIKDHKKVIERLKEMGDYLVTSQYVFCLPRISFGTLKYEWELRKFPLIKRSVATYPWPPTFTTRSLRKLKS